MELLEGRTGKSLVEKGLCLVKNLWSMVGEIRVLGEGKGLEWWWVPIWVG